MRRRELFGPLGTVATGWPAQAQIAAFSPPAALAVRASSRRACHCARTR